MEENVSKGRHLDHNAFDTGQPDSLSMGVGLQIGQFGLTSRIVETVKIRKMRVFCGTRVDGVGHVSLSN